VLAPAAKGSELVFAGQKARPTRPPRSFRRLPIAKPTCRQPFRFDPAAAPAGDRRGPRWYAAMPAWRLAALRIAAAHLRRCYAWGMARYEIEQGRRGRGTRAGRITLIVLLLVLLFGTRSLASYAIEFQWWKELGQFNTYLSMMWYSVAPVVAATLLAFGILWLAHARALRFAGTSLREHRLYNRISALGLLFLGWLIADSSIDTWTVVRFAGSRGLPASATAWHDSVFNQPLSFYLFDLPFYNLLRGDRLHPGVLGGGARLAVALSPPRTARVARP